MKIRIKSLVVLLLSACMLLNVTLATKPSKAEETQKIFGIVPNAMAMFKTKMYYINQKDKAIYSFDVKAKKIKKTKLKKYSKFCFYNKKVYALSQSKIYSVTLKGKKKLITKCADFLGIYRSQIYYTEGKDGDIYKTIGLTGAGAATLDHEIHMNPSYQSPIGNQFDMFKTFDPADHRLDSYIFNYTNIVNNAVSGSNGPIYSTYDASKSDDEQIKITHLYYDKSSFMTIEHIPNPKPPWGALKIRCVWVNAANGKSKVLYSYKPQG